MSKWNIVPYEGEDDGDEDDGDGGDVNIKHHLEEGEVWGTPIAWRIFAQVNYDLEDEKFVLQVWTEQFTLIREVARSYHWTWIELLMKQFNPLEKWIELQHEDVEPIHWGALELRYDRETNRVVSLITGLSITGYHDDYYDDDYDGDDDDDFDGVSTLSKLRP